MEIKNSTELKKHNQFAILNQIIDNQPLSRADLTKNLDVSHATISSLVKELIEQGLVVETEYSQSTGGRPPKLLEFNGSNQYIITMEVEEKHIHYGIFDLNLEMKCQKTIEEDYDSLTAILEELKNGIKENLKNEGIEQRQVIALGISIPGIYKREEDIIIDSKTKLWEKQGIKEHITSLFQLPVYIENDANLAAYYEWGYGVARGNSNLIYIHLGDGIGGGLIIDDNLYRGGHGNAGEVGHLKVRAGGKKCECGGTGCLETISSRNAIIEEVKEEIKAGGKTQLSGTDMSSITIEDIITAYGKNDQLCRQVVDRAFNYLATGLSSLVNVFDPDLIVLGGMIHDFQGEVLQKIRSQLEEICFPNMAEELKLVRSSRQDKLQLYAAATYVFDKWKQLI